MKKKFLSLAFYVAIVTMLFVLVLALLILPAGIYAEAMTAAPSVPETAGQSCENTDDFVEILKVVDVGKYASAVPVILEAPQHIVHLIHLALLELVLL